jgi:putative thioredoxin
MDVGTDQFQREVIDASRAQPVVVDFWAPWCGPCRALGPVLEKVAESFAGRVKLVKVNSDDNPELSQAFGIRSIPNVIAFKAGNAVAQFMGAVPEAQVRAFFERLLPSAAEEALMAAEAAFAAGRLDEAEELLRGVPPSFELKERMDALAQELSFARASRDGPDQESLRTALASNPDDHDARLGLANLYAGQRRYREAMDELIELVRRARTWRDGIARTQLLALFTIAEHDGALVAEYRRKLATVLH